MTQFSRESKVKSSAVLFAIAFLLFVSSFAQAQDAASNPFRPGASPTPEELPTPTPTPQPTPRPRVQKKPSPSPTIAAEEATPSATPEKKPTIKPAATAERTPAPTVAEKPETRRSQAAEENQGSVAAKLKELEKRWEVSLLNHHTDVIERLVADDFVGTSSSGKVGGKSTLLAEARRDKNFYKSAVSRHMSVHSYGAHVAVVLGIAKETGKDSGGRSFSHTYRFTDTWVERNGEWQCVAAHAMVMPKK